MNKTIAIFTGVIGGVTFLLFTEILLTLSTLIPPPAWFFEQRAANPWIVHIWRIVEWGPAAFLALGFGWLFLHFAQGRAVLASLIAALVVSLILVTKLSSPASLLSVFSLYLILLLPVSTFLIDRILKNSDGDNRK